MGQSKHYILDTNVLLEDPNALLKLRNGSENSVSIPYHVILELNKLKNDPRLGHIVSAVVRNLSSHTDKFNVLQPPAIANTFAKLVDTHILEEILTSNIENPILVTNDKLFQFQAGLKGLKCESYKESEPFKSQAEMFSGFIQEEEKAIPNAFFWNQRRKPVMVTAEGNKVIDYQHKVWNVVPRNIYQNLALELMTNTEIAVTSIQSKAGYGKSYLALAAALYLSLERKEYSKIYLIKPMIEIGQKMGFLPGKLEEKMEPYTRYVSDLILKLHRLRPVNRLFINNTTHPPVYDPKHFELLPIAYIRGLNLENAVVIIDEMQNLSRAESRALLSRMGEGVKCICLGDIHQVDNPYLNSENNGLNWVVNKFKGSPIYAHLVMKGERSRGPITDLVIKSGL
jgi:PhoH-like ATPase